LCGRNAKKLYACLFSFIYYLIYPEEGVAPEGYACTRGAFLCWKDACNLYNVKMPVGVVAEIITPGLLKLFSNDW